MHHLPSLRNSFNACHVLSAGKNPRCSLGGGAPLWRGVPAKFHKKELPPNLTVQKIPYIPYQIYQPASAGNLPIPAKLPVNRWDTTLVFWGEFSRDTLVLPAFFFVSVFNRYQIYLAHHLPARIYGIFGGKKISFFCSDGTFECSVSMMNN